MLYKIDTKGKIRTWAIKTGNDEDGFYYETESGIKDGAIQKFRVYVKSGKNIGQSNETSEKEQCEREAESLRKKQIERNGYSEQVPETKQISPMLAKEWKNESHKIKFPCMIQPKLDGIRVLAHITKGGVKLISRKQKEFLGLEHISTELAGLYKGQDIILDGELFNKDISFQDIQSLVKKTKNFTSESEKIQMWVYDMISQSGYHQRYIDFSNLISGLKNIICTPTYIVRSIEEIDSRHKQFTNNGYEGSMIRNLESYYKIGSRSDDLLKYKDFIDKEFKIIGFKNGKGKFSHVPTFILVTESGDEFEAVPAGSSEQRKEYLENAQKYISKYATVKYFEYTTGSNPVPRFPVIIEMDRTT